MDWEEIHKRLRQVERSIALGERLIGRARKRLEKARQLKLDPAEGKRVIKVMEAMQKIRCFERDELKKLLRSLAN